MSKSTGYAQQHRKRKNGSATLSALPAVGWSRKPSKTSTGSVTGIRLSVWRRQIKRTPTTAPSFQTLATFNFLVVPDTWM